MDLRLAPMALGCWAAALTILHTGLRVGLAVLGVAVVAGAVACRLDRRWRWIVLSAFVGVACGAGVTAARLSNVEAPEITGLVAQRVTASVELTVTDDPRPARAATGRTTTWVVPARLTQTSPKPGIEGPKLTTDVRVLVLASHNGWRSLVPGQRVRADVRFGASRGGDLKAAVLSTSTAPVPLGAPPWHQEIAAVLRAGLQRACEPLDDAPGGLLPGLVVGDTSRLLAEVEQDFRDTGMTHLNAVSGSNVAIVVGCVIFLARWCRFGPRWTAVLAASAVVGFVILARPSPSVLRAAVMGGVGLLALAGGRSRAALPALCAAVIVLVAIDPELAGDAGFALSVLATSGLLVLAPRMRDSLRRKGIPAGTAEALAVPASAQLACAPVVAGLSGTVSLISVPANLLAVPAIAPATLIGVVAAVLSPIWPGAAQFAAWLGSWPAWWLVKVAEVGSEIPAAVVPWPAGVGGALLLTALTIVVLLGFRYRGVRLTAVVVALAAVVGALPVRLMTGGWPPPGWLVVACDVGQGDAIVLRAGPAAAVVVDAGPDASAVDGCLRRLSVAAVPIAFVSHYHLDHIGGLEGLFNHNPAQLVTPAWTQPATGYEAVLRAAGQAGVPVSLAAPGSVWTVGELTLRVLSTSPISGTRSDPNNNSLILVAVVRGVRVLLLGDAETEQQALLRQEHASLRADIVKVAHHGSAYQDAQFLDTLRPRVALVSVGVGNGYGHPHESVLALFQRNGARVCRTDTDGDVAVVTTGSTGELAVVRR